jgi:hypothetical protein
MKKLSILSAMALVLGVVGIANGDFGNWSFENGLSGLSVESTRGGELEVYNTLGSGIITPTLIYNLTATRCNAIKHPIRSAGPNSGRRRKL